MRLAVKALGLRLSLQGFRVRVGVVPVVACTIPTLGLAFARTVDIWECPRVARYKNFMESQQSIFVGFFRIVFYRPSPLFLKDLAIGILNSFHCFFKSVSLFVYGP